MMYLIYNTDGSIKALKVGESIQQGNNGVNQIFVSVDGMSVSDYTATAYFVLPDDSVSSVIGVIGSVEGVNGYLITLTSSQTLYAGKLEMSLALKDLQNNTLWTYEYQFIVNPTGYTATEVNISMDMWDSLVQSLNSYALKIDIRKIQDNIAVIRNPLTNINGRVLTNFESVLTTDDFTYYTITKGEENLTSTTAADYMEYMSGTRYVPVYDYEKPQNSYWLMSDFTLWKPQYASGEFRLYKMGQLVNDVALANAVKRYKHTLVMLDYDNHLEYHFVVISHRSTAYTSNNADLIKLIVGTCGWVNVNDTYESPCACVSYSSGKYYFNYIDQDGNTTIDFDPDYGSNTFADTIEELND